MLPAMLAPSLPRRFRSFSLRTLMVLVGVACLAMTWFASERQFVMERSFGPILQCLTGPHGASQRPG